MKRSISLTTPEGVPLDLETAELGDRFLAWVLDVLIMALVVVGVMLALLPFGADARIAVLIVLGFVLRNFYFPLNELRSGRSPGKRARNLQVVAIDGGPLTPGMIVARNVTRELETAAPLTLLFGGLDLSGPSALAAVLAIVWLLVVTGLPLLSRRRARLGDLLAGTAVVQVAPAILLPDLSAGTAVATDRPTFTAEQLDIYGIAELHVLEDLLRRKNDEPRAKALALVAEKIRAKIGWAPPSGPVADEVFLRAFYDAQRTRLEHKLAHGRRQERKRT